MEPNSLLALVKFFRDENYLDQLIAGHFYCQTPETYRLERLEGVGDPFESCTYSYRQERGDQQVQITFNGLDISDVMGFTVQPRASPDSWLNCWACITVPQDESALKSLKADVRQMKHEFGKHYACIAPQMVRPFIEYLQTQTPHILWCKSVSYSSNRAMWSRECKAIEYSYQREFRFGLGECSTHEIAPYDLVCDSSLEKFIIKSPDLTMKSKDGATTWFDLRSA